MLTSWSLTSSDVVASTQLGILTKNTVEKSLSNEYITEFFYFTLDIYFDMRP